MFWDKYWMALVGLLLVLLTGISKIVLDSVQGGHFPWYVILIIALVVVDVLIVFVLARILVFEDFFRQLKPTLERIGSIREGHTLISQEETSEIEKAARKVWIVTKDFWWDLENQKFANDVVFPNIQKGIEYRYLYPDTLEGNSSAEILVGKIRQLCPHSRNPLKPRVKVSLHAAPQEVFDPLMHEIIIYHGSRQDNSDTVAVIVYINGKRHESSEVSRDLLIPYPKVVDRYRQMFLHLEKKSQERYKVQ